MAKPPPATKVEPVLWPNADATAPGGMSQAALRVELAEHHGMKMNETRDMPWPALIEAVCQGRLATGDGLEDEDTYDEAEDSGFEADHPDEVTRVKVRKVEEPDDECKHGEDPLDCDACEAEALGEDVVTEYGDNTPVRVTVSQKAPEPEPEVVDEDDEVAMWLSQVTAERDDAEAGAPPTLFLGMPGVHDYTFNGHAGTGPSAAERWMKCTASLGMSRKFLENLSPNQQAEFANANMAARQGTTAHAAAEVEARVLLGEMDENTAEHVLYELAIDPPHGEDYTEEMAEFITEYTDLIKQHIDSEHPVVIEQRVFAAVPLTAPVPLDTLESAETSCGKDDDGTPFYVIPGSADCISYPTEDDPVLTVIDLKYGEGKDVDPVENPQAMIYALGALAKFLEDGGDLADIAAIEVIIAQPRLGGIKSWITTVDDLLDWQDASLSPALTAALGLAPAEFSPGEDTCQWCPARGGCKALANERVAAASELFTALDEAEFGDGPALVAADLDNERLASLLKQVAGLADLHADLKAEAQRRMHRGVSLPGMVLVNYSPARTWVEGAERKLAKASMVWTAPKLMSPTQAIKALAPEFEGDTAKAREAAATARLAKLIETPEKRPVVAFEGDRRSLWTGKAPEQMFDDLPDDE